MFLKREKCSSVGHIGKHVFSLVSVLMSALTAYKSSHLIIYLSV